ncbi:hypothetical protein LINPERHAP2_LOCUS26982 [Linum perenne]
MSRKLPQLWAKKGSIVVSDVGFGFYIVRFETVADYERALFGGPWMINDHYVVIQEWRPYFRPEDTILTTLRVWVRLPGLPLEYFDHSILKIIGDRIGRTVRIDHTTLEGSRGNFARLCVEVDLSKPLLSKYRLRRRVRRIEYEGLHVICFNCGCYGHKDETCKKEPEAEIVHNQTTLFANPVFQGAAEPECRPEVEEDFGSWMQVKRNRRKNKPVISPAAVPPSSVSPAGNDKKGNSFSALVFEESEEVLVEEILEKDTEPLGKDCEEDFMEDISVINKENVDPSLRGVGSKGCSTQNPFPSVSLGSASAHLPPSVDGAPVIIGASVKPIISVGLSRGPISDGSIAKDSEAQSGPASGSSPIPVVHAEVIASGNFLPDLTLSNSRPPSGVAREEAQKAPVSNRSFVPPKSSKITKSKKRDSTSTLGLKARDESQRNVPIGSSSAMEET